MRSNAAERADYELELNPEGETVREAARLLYVVPNYAVTAEPPPPSRRSLLELRGLGKEIWEGVDAQEYVNELRNEWPDR